MPQLQKLTLATLPEVARGHVQVAFDRLCAAAIQDCMDRPTEKKARKINLQIAFVPVAELIGNEYFAENAAVKLAIKPTFPQLETNTLDFAIRSRNGQAEAVFAPDSPENVDQATLFDHEDEDELEPTDPD